MAQTEAIEKATDFPEGWAIVPFGDCVDILDHLRVPVNSDERQNRPGEIPYYGATGQVGWIDGFIFDEELVLLGEDGAPFLDKSKTIAYLIRGKSWVNNHAHVLRAKRDITINAYVKYALDAFDFTDHVNGTTRLKLTQGAMRSIPLALPPFAEQKRIVAKVEELLGRVSAARERLAKVPALLKRFRQSVLAAACSGQLTADWRDDRSGSETASGFLKRVLARREKRWSDFVKTRYKTPVDADPDNSLDCPEGWAVASVDQLTVVITSGSRDWSKYYGRGTGTFIMAQNVRPGFLDLSFRQPVEPPNEDRDRARSQVARGDLLVTIVGANTGDVCPVTRDLPEHYVCQSVSLMRPVETTLAPYLNLYLNSATHGRGEYERYIYGEGRPHLSFDHLRMTAVLLPPLAEQREIVRRVEALFALADKIEARVQAATARVEKITQAILAKAFRGELVPTEAELARQEGRDYEPASVLLDRIRREREAQTNGKSRSKRPIGKPPRRKG